MTGRGRFLRAFLWDLPNMETRLLLVALKGGRLHAALAQGRAAPLQFTASVHVTATWSDIFIGVRTIAAALTAPWSYSALSMSV